MKKYSVIVYHVIGEAQYTIEAEDEKEASKRALSSFKALHLEEPKKIYVTVCDEEIV